MIFGNESDVSESAPMAPELSSGTYQKSGLCPWHGKPAGSMAFAFQLQAFQMSI